MGDDEDYERGRADARLDEGDERHAANIARFKSIETKLDELIEITTLVKGGFRLLIAVGSFGAAVGAFVAGAFHYFSEHWK